MKDGKPIHNLYNTDAAWGAQWNLTQVWALAYPEYYSDYISSHLLVYKDAGWLADGIANSRYVSGVGTNLLSTIIAGAYQCGIRDFDVNTAYEACLKNELDGENRPLGAGKIDTPVMRYADVLLMMSEACLLSGDQQNADKYLNEVRNRAKLTRKSDVTLTDIKTERNLELAMECSTVRRCRR